MRRAAATYIVYLHINTSKYLCNVISRCFWKRQKLSQATKRPSGCTLPILSKLSVSSVELSTRQRMTFAWQLSRNELREQCGAVVRTGGRRRRLQRGPRFLRLIEDGDVVVHHSLIHAKTASICFISAQLRDGERENGISKKRQQQQEYEEEAREEDQSSPTEWGLRKHGFVTLSVVLRPLSVVDFHFVFRSYMYIIFTHLGINEYRTE